MQLTDIEIYNFFREFESAGLYFDENNGKYRWYYLTEGMKVPISRTLLEDFAKRVQYHIKEARNIVIRAKDIVIEEESDND